MAVASSSTCLIIHDNISLPLTIATLHLLLALKSKVTTLHHTLKHVHWHGYVCVCLCVCCRQQLHGKESFQKYQQSSLHPTTLSELHLSHQFRDDTIHSITSHCVSDNLSVCVCVWVCVRACAYVYVCVRLRALQAAGASLVSQHAVAFTLLDKVHNLQTRHSAEKTLGS